MDSTLSLPMEMPPLHRLRAVIGHCDTRVFIDGGWYIDVGRGSLDAVERLKFMGGSGNGHLGTIGQFCNFAPECSLYGGGEHHNAEPINVLFYNVPALSDVAVQHPTMRAAPTRPFTIGNAVLVCGHALVLAGAEIGDSAVIGAGAVATGKVDPFTVAAGVPAKKIRARTDEGSQAAIEAVRWWDFDIQYMRENVVKLQQLAEDTTAAHVYRKPEPRLMLVYGKDGTVGVRGFIADGVEHPVNDLPGRLMDSLRQLNGSGPYKWQADLWA